MTENWKKIQGYNDYEVSSLGRVKSIKKGKEKILKGGIDNNGYRIIILCKNSNQKTFNVHQLVAIAFLNHKPCGHKLVVNHKDFNRLNNRVGNLEVITHRENTNKKHIKSTSSFTGVYLDKRIKKWRSQIEINGKRIFLGYFTDEIEASEIYELALANIELYNGNKKQFKELIKTIKLAA